MEQLKLRAVERLGDVASASIDLTMLAAELHHLRGLDVLHPSITRDAAQLALSGRVRVREGSGRSASEIIDELWSIFFAPEEDEPEPDGSDVTEEPGKG